MNAEPAFEPDRLVAALNAAQVQYVIVGGLAVGAHGVVRATRDLDLVAASDQRNMGRLAECLQALGGEHPIQGSLTGAALARPRRSSSRREIASALYLSERTVETHLTHTFRKLGLKGRAALAATIEREVADSPA